MKYTIVKQLEFDGIVKDEYNKIHHIRQSWCEKCGELTGETHQNCCGYSSSGWVGKKCKCEQKPTDLSNIVFGKGGV